MIIDVRFPFHPHTFWRIMKTWVCWRQKYHSVWLIIDGIGNNGSFQVLLKFTFKEATRSVNPLYLRHNLHSMSCQTMFNDNLLTLTLLVSRNASQCSFSCDLAKEIKQVEWSVIDHHMFFLRKSTQMGEGRHKKRCCTGWSRTNMPEIHEHPLLRPHTRKYIVSVYIGFPNKTPWFRCNCQQMRPVNELLMQTLIPTFDVTRHKVFFVTDCRLFMNPAATASRVFLIEVTHPVVVWLFPSVLCAVP